MEQKVLAAAIQDREAYVKINAILRKEDFTELSFEIWKRIQSYYDKDDAARSIDVDILKKKVENELPKHADIINKTIDSLVSTSVPNLLNEIINVKTAAVAHQLAGELLANPSSDKTHALLEELQKVNELTAVHENVQSVDRYATEMLNDLKDGSGLIKLYPRELNDRIDGGVYRGNQILIFARPNAGKTQFAINLTRGFLRDGYRVLYLCNEEPKKQLIMRLLSRMLSKQKKEVLADLDSAVVEATKVGLGNLYLEEINPGTFPEINGLIRKLKPDIVVIDQIRNIQMVAESRTNQLEMAATEARNLAKKYNILSVIITQAGDSAENKLVLNMGDVDYSNTGIPAQVDLMVGVGVNQTTREQGLRTISIAKNKLSSDHGNFPVQVDESLSKIISL